MSVLGALEPARVMHYFEEICGIPHGSGNTKKISDYCVSFAKEHHLTYLQDEYNNVIIWKDGTKGYENSAPVMLQGHLDMVCEKEEGCDIDFETDGLCLQVEDGIVTAEKTTLGGDDGIAVAYALALLETDEYPHPPLEIVLTVDEEIGMLGATALDTSSLRAKTMLNLDSEDEGHLLVSCAGGVTAQVELPLSFETGDGEKYVISVSGLMGGHSGVEIDKGRANACQIMGRVLYELHKEIPFSLCFLNGGLKDNAIPRQAEAVIVCPEKRQSEINTKIAVISSEIKHEFLETDPMILVEAKKTTLVEKELAMTKDSADKVITALLCLPGGIQKMSFQMEGLVKTSLNLGIMKTEKDHVSLSFSVRSSVESEKRALLERIICLTKTLGGTVTTNGDYPAWEYLENSPLRDLMCRIFEEQYGRKPIVEALHAGVECGIFAGKIPKLDCVSFGPDMKDIHTPKESMDVESVKRTWEYLLEILKQLK